MVAEVEAVVMILTIQWFRQINKTQNKGYV